MAWMWWLLAPVASTVLGTIVIWWRSPAQTNRRLRRTDAISEHQALLRALAQQRPTTANPPAPGRPAPGLPAPGLPDPGLPDPSRPDPSRPAARHVIAAEPVAD